MLASSCYWSGTSIVCSADAFVCGGRIRIKNGPTETTVNIPSGSAEIRVLNQLLTCHLQVASTGKQHNGVLHIR